MNLNIEAHLEMKFRDSLNTNENYLSGFVPLNL